MSLPIIFALVSSAGLFAGYMWIYLSPLINDRNAVAPYTTTIATSERFFQEENRQRAGPSRQNIKIRPAISPATTRSPFPEPPSSDQSSPHEDVKSTVSRHAPQYVHTYGRDFLDPGSHTRPSNNTPLTRSSGASLSSPITPPPPVYVSHPSTPTPGYGFTDAYSDRSFGSPTPSSNERYPFRPSLSEHSPPRNDPTRPGQGSLSAQSSPSCPAIELGSPPGSGSQSSCSTQTLSQGHSDSSLYATSQSEDGSSNGGHTTACLSSGHTSPSSFSIPSYYHHRHRRSGHNKIRSIPSGTVAPGYPLPPIPTPRPQQAAAMYRPPMRAQVFQPPPSSSTATLMVPATPHPRPPHMQLGYRVDIPRGLGPGSGRVGVHEPPPLRQLDTSLVPSFPPGNTRPVETRF